MGKAQTVMTISGTENGTFSRRVALKEGFTERKVGDKIFILSKDSRMHILENRAACFLWECLNTAGEGGAELAFLVSSLCDRFEVSREVAQKDANVFIEKLVLLGIAVDCEPSKLKP